MSQQAKAGIYVYQPYGVQDGKERWDSGRIYGVGGLPIEATCKGFTKQEAEAIVAALQPPALTASEAHPRLPVLGAAGKDRG